MGAFAFFLLMITALGGTMVFIEWYEDERQHAPNGTLAVVVSHVALALASLVLLTIFLAMRGATLASAVVFFLLLTAAVGITGFLRSRRGEPYRQRKGDVGRGFLYFHGAAAAVTIIVAVMAAVAVH